MTATKCLRCPSQIFSKKEPISFTYIIMTDLAWVSQCVMHIQHVGINIGIWKQNYNTALMECRVWINLLRLQSIKTCWSQRCCIIIIIQKQYILIIEPFSWQLNMFVCQRDEPGFPEGKRDWMSFFSVLNGFSVSLKEPRILPRLSNGSAGIYEACEIFLHVLILP